jgi:hypothetical protein
MLFAVSTAGEVLFWGGFAIAAIVGVGWKMYMATCRTDDYLRLQKAEEEAREKRNARIRAAAGTIAGVIGKLRK